MPRGPAGLAAEARVRAGRGGLLSSDPWDDFVAASSTWGSSPGVREAWRKGRERYAVFLVEIEDTEIVERMERVRQALAGRLSPMPRPHLTLWVAGFPCQRPRFDDDVLVEQLEAQEQVLEPRLRFRVGGATSFLSCAALQVEDHLGELAAQRRRLDRLGRELRFAAYQPHLTVGTYLRSEPVAKIAESLNDLRQMSWIELSGHCTLAFVQARTGRLLGPGGA